MKLNTVFPWIFFFISFVFSTSDPLAANGAINSVFSSIEEAASKLLENNPRAELITLIALGLLDAETEQKLQEVESSVPEDIKKLGSTKALEKLSSSLGGLRSALGQSKKRVEHVARASFSAHGHIQRRTEESGKLLLVFLSSV